MVTAQAWLEQLIAFPSVGGSPAEAGIQHWLATRLAEFGLSVDLWPIDVAAIRSGAGYPGDEVERDEAWGLVASNRPGEEPELILQGHVDVVPVGDVLAWRTDPFVAAVIDGSMVGRGACDMKAGVAAILAAVAATRDEADLPPFAVHFVVGEEDGGLGAYATLQRGHTGRACLIPEPTGLELVTAAAGALSFRIEIPGVAAHGSTRYAGVSALDRYLPIHRALADLEERRNRNIEPELAALPIAYPLSVGRLRVGEWASTVPDLAVADGRYGIRIDEDPAQARRELEDVVLGVAVQTFPRERPPVISWPGGQFAGGRLPVGHPLADRVAALHRQVTGRTASAPRAVPYGSDLRLYAAAGIPTLHYGPGDARRAHAPNESVPLAELVVATEVLTRALRCGIS